MPPRRRVSAPANRVYESAPVLQQARFTSPPPSSKAKPKRMRSYGKKTTVRPRKTKDNTLTQMGWVVDNTPPVMSESEEEQGEEYGNGGVDEEGEGDYEGEARRRRAKRRRTMGDANEKSVGATPKLYHTQTISQVVRSFNSMHESEEDGTMEDVHEEEQEQEQEQLPPAKRKKDIFDVPSSSPVITRARKPTPRRGRSSMPGKENITEKPIEENTLPTKSPARNLMPPPGTPHRLSSVEIPSSQSPATPLTLPSTRSSRIAFQEQSVNIPINFGPRSTPKESKTGEEDITSSEREPQNKARNVKSPLKNIREENGDIDMAEKAPLAIQSGKVPNVTLFWNPNPRRTGEVSPVKAPVLEVRDTYDTGAEVSQMVRNPPKLEIRDTYETTTEVSQMTRIPSSPMRIRSSPMKSVRFDIPFEFEEQGTPTKGKALSEEPEPESPSPVRKRTVILDSDAESDEEDLAEEYEELGGHVESENVTEAFGANNMENVNQEDPEEPLEEVGMERVDDATEADEAEYVDEDGSQEELLGEVAAMIMPHIIKTHLHNIGYFDKEDHDNEAIPSSSHARGPSPDLDAESDYGEIGAETQFQVDKLTSSSHVSLTPQDDNIEEPEPETCLEKTQYFETQRIDTQHVNNMAPRTGESDVFVAMPSMEITSILDRTRNHIIRAWKLAPNVSRVWIYELQPVSTLKYMAEISDLKKPKELPEVGIGNDSFNIRPKGTPYGAHKILQLYELLNPVELVKLNEKGWFDDGPPKKWQRLAPAVIDELMSNLKPPLFDIQDGVGEAVEQTWESSKTDTQEVNGQLMSNIQQYTQLASVPIPENEAVVEEKEVIEEEERVPSSPFKLPALSQATTVDLTQVQTPRHRRHRSVEMVLESPSRPTMSSTPLQLSRHRTPRSGRRGGVGSSTGERSSTVRRQEEGKGEEEQEQQSLMPFSMASSQLQLLTKSQLLSESLLQDSVPEPPDWVPESEDEDDLL